MNKLFLRYYTSHEYLTVDKQLVPFRGRCPFKHYLPSKPDKYGIKFFWICGSSTFYPLTTKPFLGKQGNVPKRGLAQDVVFDLSTPFNNSGRNIITDDYFTDLFLEVNLLQNGFTLIGTVRKNKTIVPANFLQSSTREVYSSTFSFQRNITFMSDVSKKPPFPSCADVICKCTPNSCFCHFGICNIDTTDIFDE